jgi:broad-specificity NMP kinase
MTAKTRTPIPRRIRVGSKQYSVDIVETMLRKRDMARVYYRTNKIELGQFSNVTGKQFDDDKVQENFWHEVTHAILYDMGEDKLNNNEKFVIEFSKRLAQAIKSARF